MQADLLQQRQQQGQHLKEKHGTSEGAARLLSAKRVLFRACRQQPRPRPPSKTKRILHSQECS